MIHEKLLSSIARTCFELDHNWILPSCVCNSILACFHIYALFNIIASPRWKWYSRCLFWGFWGQSSGHQRLGKLLSNHEFVVQSPSTVENLIYDITNLKSCWNLWIFHRIFCTSIVLAIRYRYLHHFINIGATLNIGESQEYVNYVPNITQASIWGIGNLLTIFLRIYFHRGWQFFDSFVLSLNYAPN